MKLCQLDAGEHFRVVAFPPQSKSFEKDGSSKTTSVCMRPSRSNPVQQCWGPSGLCSQASCLANNKESSSCLAEQKCKRRCSINSSNNKGGEAETDRND